MHIVLDFFVTMCENRVSDYVKKLTILLWLKIIYILKGEFT